MSLWLKMIGASDMQVGPRPFDDRGDMAREVRFPKAKFPHQVTPGDEFIYYAVGHYRIFAVARLIGRVERDVRHENPEIFRRWPHAGPIELGPHIEDLAFAPFLKDIAPDLKAEIHQGTTFLPMGRPEFDRAAAAIVKRRDAERLRTKRLQRQA
jgi:hypothetical protein